MRAGLIAAAAGALAAGSVWAGPILIYAEDFETLPLGSEWSTNTVTTSHALLTRYAGRYSESQSISLKLPPFLDIGIPGDDEPGDPPPGDDGPGGGGGTGYLLVFDLYVIDSWDGSSTAWGPDHFQVVVNGEVVFDETFANQHSNQSYRAPDVGPTHLGYNGAYKDSIYYDIPVAFELDGPVDLLHIKFRGLDLQGLVDESWGIDNVRLYLVPTPASMALLGLAALTVASRRRVRGR